MSMIRNGWVLLPRTVIDPTHARGGILDILMTDAPDLVQVAVVAPLRSLDHSPLSAAISMAQAVPNLCVSRRVLLKHRVNWTAVCEAIGEPPLLLLSLKEVGSAAERVMYTLSVRRPQPHNTNQ